MVRGLLVFWLLECVIDSSATASPSYLEKTHCISVLHAWLWYLGTEAQFRTGRSLAIECVPLQVSVGVWARGRLLPAGGKHSVYFMFGCLVPPQFSWWLSCTGWVAGRGKCCLYSSFPLIGLPAVLVLPLQHNQKALSLPWSFSKHLCSPAILRSKKQSVKSF